VQDVLMQKERRQEVPELRRVGTKAVLKCEIRIDNEGEGRENVSGNEEQR